MKLKNKKPAQRKIISKDKLKAVLFLLMTTLGVKGFADPVWANIIDNDPEGKFNSYYLDKSGNGIEDGVLKILQTSAMAPLFKRYLQVGGRVLYENEGRDDFEILDKHLLRIEMPDGRIIKINDISGRYANYFNFAREYEAREASVSAGR